ncbi:helix-turn-helix domain-containing protein [Nocardia sp. alder85J]|uniref:helix-turn-helix domain-containing protein n=1 Tax=Nocardia sp. alder85J TaxID=2862949 RepID=UPI001CD353B7|nr:helix-turn-helix domain-containing protein [Nocardia sp. alder85J]MCX4097127.1 helix-turn-helix domain-containing protein [Nocardia sp. alder85J]
MSVVRATVPRRGAAVVAPPVLATTVVRGIVDELLGDRTRGRTRADLTLVVNLCATELARALAGEAPVSADALAQIETVAARWAQLDRPVEPLQHAVHAGAGTAFRHLAPALTWSSVRTVRANGLVLIDIIRTMSTAVSRGYVREIRALAAEQRAVVQTLTARLIAGNATRADTPDDLDLADSYRVLAVALGPHPDEHDRRLDARVVARRKLRRVQAELAATGHAGVLAQLSVDGGTLLLPLPGRTGGLPDPGNHAPEPNDRATDPPGTADPIRDTAHRIHGMADRVPGTADRAPGTAGETDTLVARLERAAGAPITVAAVDTDRDDIPHAVEFAHELLDLAVRLDRGPGLYRFEDLACEYQLGRPGTANEKIRSVLAPLQTEPELERMLWEFLAAGGRAATAQRLGVPVGVLRRRLARVTELTGLDPSRATDLWYLRSSMIARAIHRSGPGDDPDSPLGQAV